MVVVLFGVPEMSFKKLGTMYEKMHTTEEGGAHHTFWASYCNN